MTALPQVLVVAATLYMEAGGEPMEGKRAVASVVWNRAKQSGRTFAEICTEPKQFSAWNDPKAYSRIAAKLDNPIEARAYADCMTVARSMIYGDFTPSGPWTHYYAGAAPYWAVGRQSARVGNQYFVVID